MITPTATFRRLHEGQLRIAANLTRKNLLRAGRRFGKTSLLEDVFVRRALRGRAVCWLCEQYKLITPTYLGIKLRHGAVITKHSQTANKIDFLGGGLIEFWTLDNEDAGRSRAYDDIVIDEASLKEKDLRMIVETALMPTMIDRPGTTITMAGTPKGINEESYFYVAAIDKTLGYQEFHAPTWANPYLDEESVANLKANHPPLVYLQEYCAMFVDWSGDAFFSLDKLLVDGQPVEIPALCDTVLVFIDTALKTGKERDGTASLICAYQKVPFPRLTILEWDLRQIEGGSLNDWLPEQVNKGYQWAERCRARFGFGKVLIEDKGSGTVLIQQARRRDLPVGALEMRLTEMGKDERALNASGYVWRGLVKLCRTAYDKTCNYKGFVANHLLKQVIGYRPGVKDPLAEDDLLDTFTYGAIVAHGDTEGW